MTPKYYRIVSIQTSRLYYKIIFKVKIKNNNSLPISMDFDRDFLDPDLDRDLDFREPDLERDLDFLEPDLERDLLALEPVTGE